MRFETWGTGIAQVKADCLVVGIFEPSELSTAARQIDQECGGWLSKIVRRGDFPGRLGETMLLAALPRFERRRVLLTGLGPRKSYGRRPWRKACAAVVAALAPSWRGVRPGALLELERVRSAVGEGAHQTATSPATLC